MDFLVIILFVAVVVWSWVIVFFVRRIRDVEELVIENWKDQKELQRLNEKEFQMIWDRDKK